MDRAFLCDMFLTFLQPSRLCKRYVVCLEDPTILQDQKREKDIAGQQSQAMLGIDAAVFMALEGGIQYIKAFRSMTTNLQQAQAPYTMTAREIL